MKGFYRLTVKGKPVRASGSKYRNQRTNRFASKREANAYAKLKAMENAHLISQLRTQVSFPIIIAGDLICRYVADFVYFEPVPVPVSKTRIAMRQVVADAKGYRTREYLLKKKLMKAIHGIEIREL